MPQTHVGAGLKPALARRIRRPNGAWASPLALTSLAPNLCDPDCRGQDWRPSDPSRRDCPRAGGRGDPVCGGELEAPVQAGNGGLAPAMAKALHRPVTAGELVRQFRSQAVVDRAGTCILLGHLDNPLGPLVNRGNLLRRWARRPAGEHGRLERFQFSQYGRIPSQEPGFGQGGSV